MSKRGVWIPQKMTYVKDDKIKSYRAYICSECNNEQITATNYCNRCGSCNYKEGTGGILNASCKKVFSENCLSCAFLARRTCSGEQPCKECDNYSEGCNCWKKASKDETSCPFWRST